MFKTPKRIWTLLAVVLMFVGAITAQDVDEETTDEPDARVARSEPVKR